MCKNAQKTAYDLLLAEEPTIKNILTLEGVAGTPQAVLALSAYDQALTDLADWVPGTASQDVLEALADVQTAIPALPIPVQYQLLGNTIVAAIITVIAVVTGNSPAASAEPLPEGVDYEEAQQDNERATIAIYTPRAQALVPFYKLKTRATWLPERTPKAQYKACWNKAVQISAAPDAFKL